MNEGVKWFWYWNSGGAIQRSHRENWWCNSKITYITFSRTCTTNKLLASVTAQMMRFPLNIWQHILVSSVTKMLWQILHMKYSSWKQRQYEQNNNTMENSWCEQRGDHTHTHTATKGAHLPLATYCHWNENSMHAPSSVPLKDKSRKKNNRLLTRSVFAQ